MPEVVAHYVDPADLVPEEQLACHLGPQEKLLRAGRPSLALVLRAHDFYFIPFSLVLCVMAVLWGGTALTKPMGFGFTIIGILLVFLAFYLCFVRFFVDMRQRECIFYGVTNERVIIVYGVFARRVKSLSLNTLSQTSLNERRNGAGSISFGGKPPWPIFVIRDLPFSPALSRFELTSDAR